MGSNAPKSFDEYWELKYHSDCWDQFKDYTESIQTGDLSAFADFDLYLKTEQDINNALIGKTAGGGIKITGQSPEFINDVIGSVSEKKSGVEISDIEKALQTRPIKIGNNVCYVLDGVCEVYINPLSGELIEVLSLMH